MSTGRDSRSATNPSRSAQATNAYAATTSASTAASTAKRSGSPPASGAIVAAVSTAVVDSGPTDSCRDDPSTA